MATDSRVVDILAKFEALRRQGQKPSLTELCRDHPGLLDEARRRLHDLHATPVADSANVSTHMHSPGPGATADRPSAPGYEILDEIGSGGMGVVYRVRDFDLHREIVLKTPKSLGSDNDIQVKKRFLEEASITAQLQHPGIPPVHEVGTLADGRPYMTMKWVKGETLSAQLKARPNSTVDVDRFLRCFEQICETLAYAHDRDIVHRDLKPANVMIGQFGEVQVMDWGLAKKHSRGAEAPDGTETAEIKTMIQSPRPDDAVYTRGAVGTWTYASPEQARGQVRNMDKRSDVFSLGAILGEILMGWPPYVYEGHKSVAEQAQDGDVATAFARLEVCGADRELIDLAKKCLSPNRVDRPADAPAVYQAVKKHREGLARRAQQGREEAAAARAKAAEERKRRKATLTLSSVALVTLLLGITVSLWQTMRASHHAGNADRAAQNEGDQRRRAEEHLVTSYLERGHRAAAGDDRYLAALAYVEAFAFDNNVEREALHRARLAAVLHRTPRLAWTFETKKPIRHASFSPDGSRLVLAGVDQIANLVDVRSGKSIGAPLEHKGAVLWTTFSPDGKRVATGSTDQFARVWDAFTGKQIAATLMHPGSVRQVHFDPSGAKLVTVGGSSVPLWWDAESGKPLFDPTQVIVTSRRVTAWVLEKRETQDSHGMSKVYTAKVEREVRKSEKHTVLGAGQPELVQAEFAGKQWLVCLSEDGLLRRFPCAAAPIPTGEEFPNDIPAKPIHFAVSADGKKLAVGTASGSVLLYHGIGAKTDFDQHETVGLHDMGVNCVALSLDGKHRVSGGTHRDARLWPQLTDEMRTEKHLPPEEPKKLPEKEPANQYEKKMPSQEPKKSPSKKPAEKPVTFQESPLISTGGDPDLHVEEVGFSWVYEFQARSQPAQVPVQPAQPVQPTQQLPPLREIGEVTGKRSIGSRFPTLPSDESSANPNASGTAAASSTGVFINSTRDVLPHGNTVHRTVFRHDGRFVLTASEDQTARIWDSRTGEPITPSLRHGGAVRFAAWSPDGKQVVTCGEDALVKLWDVSHLEPADLILPCAGAVSFAEFTSKGKTIVTTDDQGETRFWDSATGKPSEKRFENAPIGHAALDPSGGLLVTVGQSNSASIWDLHTGKELRKLPHTGEFFEAVFSAGGRLLLTTGLEDGAAHVWDTQTGKAVAVCQDSRLAGSRRPELEYDGRMTAAIDTEGRWVATAGQGPAVQLWDVAKNKTMREITVGGRTIYHVCFSPDGLRLFTAGTESACVWDVATGQRLTQPMKHRGNVYSGEFSADGKLLATAGSDGTARIWDAATGKPHTPPLAHEQFVHRVWFAPDGKSLLTISADTARVWDVATGQPITPPLRHTNAILWAAFDSTGRNIVTASRDQTARVWRLPPPETRSIAELRQFVSQHASFCYDTQGSLTPIE